MEELDIKLADEPVFVDASKDMLWHGEELAEVIGKFPVNSFAQNSCEVYLADPR